MEFTKDHPQETANWMEQSNYVVLLNVHNEDELLDIAAELYDHPQALFVEPDLNDSYTALAVLANRKTLSSLPLMGKGVNA